MSKDQQHEAEKAYGEAVRNLSMPDIVRVMGVVDIEEPAILRHAQQCFRTLQKEKTRNAGKHAA